ncbi:uncharacterized protein METZ01_LOCUS35268 [marine metagenome]|uniref:Uncharacterized protein n=1 Tax=marine metagenome TaxID=408172 RepID=A0A381QTZ5_9ZZZZ
MKKINIYLISLAMMAFSCSKEFSSDEYGGYEMLTDYMLKEYQVGAALRTITESGSYRFFDPGNSLWSATLEPHDHESGGLTESVDWYVSNGGNNEVLARTVSRSEMYEGPVGLPRMDISMSLVEAGGLVGGYQGGNTIIHRMVLKLTDGRTFSTESVSGSLTQSYFKSPFQYRKTITCFMDAGIVAAVPGLYTVNMTDSWGDGWNGAAVVMTLDGVDYSTSFNSGSADTIVFEVPASASTMGFKFVAGAWDSEVDFNIVYSKLDGSNSQTALPNVGASPPTGYYALSVCQ